MRLLFDSIVNIYFLVSIHIVLYCANISKVDLALGKELLRYTNHTYTYINESSHALLELLRVVGQHTSNAFIS